MSNLKSKSKILNLSLLLIIGLVLIYMIFKNITSSVFLKEKDRVNVVFYSQNSKFFSFSKKEVNYLVKFPAEIEILIPGGYGFYRSGALGKLAVLENKPELFKRAFSATTSTFVDLYFYPAKTEIYYDTSVNKSFPSVGEIFLNKSNANIIDKVILFSLFLKRNDSDYKIISLDSILYDREQFKKDIQGSFYKKIYRAIGENVQIIYKKSYSTALSISSIIDGEGIRVVDLSQEKEDNKNCQVITKKPSLISQELSRYFDCQLKIGEITISDIILKLGSLEKDWAVR